MSRGRHFDLYFGDTTDGASSNDDPPEEGAVQILARLRILQSYQESARDEDLYNTFSIGPPTVYTPEDVFTNEVAAAVVDFFHREAAAGRRWESLNLVPFVSTEAFGRMLEGAKSSGIFSSCQIFPDVEDDWDDILPGGEERILRQFCRGNSSLERLMWSGTAYTRATLGALDEILHDVSCKITHLTLCFYFPLWGVPLRINVLEGCHSLESLVFAGGGSIDEELGCRILNLVSTCPRLKEIKLSKSNLTGDLSWSRSIRDQCNLDARKRLSTLPSADAR